MADLHDGGSDGWLAHSKLVLGELARLNTHVSELSREITDMRIEIGSRDDQASKIRSLEDKVASHQTEIAILKMKATGWGAFGGIVVAIAAMLLRGGPG